MGHSAEPHEVCLSYQDDTSGDYQAMLLALIGDRPAPSPTAEEVEAAEEPAELEEVEEENVQVSCQGGTVV